MRTRKKCALITGITGQDGYYLSRLLLGKGYDVFGMVRRSSNDPLVKFNREPELKKKIKILYGNLRDSGSLVRIIKESRPDEIYNLGAQSDVGVSFKCPEETLEINYFGLGRLVQAVLDNAPKARIYQASTSEMFGSTKPRQNELSPFRPVSPYGAAKLRAHEDFVVGYREKHGLFICSGILFNHESPMRGEHFVTRKITISLAKIKLGLQKDFRLGNLNSKRDWGFAGDYVNAMWLMLQRRKPEDFVVGIGKSSTVRQFVVEACRALDMNITFEGKGMKEVGRDQNGRIILRVASEFYRPNEVNHLEADSSKARKVLGWKPEVDFKELVKIMTASDLKRLSAERNRQFLKV